MNILLSELENILRSEAINVHDLAPAINGVSIDSRTINKNELFIAIKGAITMMALYLLMML